MKPFWSRTCNELQTETEQAGNDATWWMPSFINILIMMIIMTIINKLINKLK